MTTPEGEVKEACHEIAATLDCLMLPWVSPGNRGVMDHILIAPWCPAVFIEFKRPTGGRIGPLQNYWRDEFIKRGHPVWRVRQIEDFKRRVEDLIAHRGKP